MTKPEDIYKEAVEAARIELSNWDDEFDSPKWAAATRARMAEAITQRIFEVVFPWEL